MTQTVPERATIEDLAFEPVCTSDICKQENPPATHWVSAAVPCGCGGEELLCPDCTSTIVGQLNMNPWRCPGCETIHLTRFGAYITIKPLHG